MIEDKVLRCEKHPLQDNVNMTEGMNIKRLSRLAGTLCVWTAGVLAVLIFVDKWTNLSVPFPAFWFTSRSFHVPACVILLVLGWLCHRNAANVPEHNAAATVSFQNVIVYSKPDCCLCDRALDVLSEFSHSLPAIQTLDISGNEKLEALYSECVPVVEIDGRVRFRGIVSPDLLERLIEAKQRQSEC